MKHKEAKPSAGGDASAEHKKKRKHGKAHGKKSVQDKASSHTHHVVDPEEPVSHKTSETGTTKKLSHHKVVTRRQMFKHKWPSVTKVKIKTKPWQPPGRPEKVPKVMIEMPELKLHRWVPPYLRRRRRRPRRMRIPPEEMNQPLYECAKLKKIWHGFTQVEPNKMMIQGSQGCNSKKYSSTACGAQTGCIALVARALLEDKTPDQLVKRDVDDVIENGDRYYRQCIVALKCYKGKPALQLHQMLNSFFFRDTKYTVHMSEIEKGVLAKHPDNEEAAPDFMQLMEKRVGTNFMMILTIGGTDHFLVWGHPPSPDAGSQAKTICYIFDPHMLNDIGQPLLWDQIQGPLCCGAHFGGGGFLRYAGVTSFVVDFLSNYGNLTAASRHKPKPYITLTSIDVISREPLYRKPLFSLDFKTLTKHCKSEWQSLHINTLYDKKLAEGQYPLASLSAVSLATSRGTGKKKMTEFYQKVPIESLAMPPVMPERAPTDVTKEQILSLRGEDFFLFCPMSDGHTYGRDDLIPLPKSETILHSPVEKQEETFESQYKQLDVGKWIIRGTRHHATRKYSKFKYYTGVACCLAAIGTLQRLKARAWNEDTVDETLDQGFNIFRESLGERKGPPRRLVLGEMKETFKIRDREYKLKDRGIAVWGKLISQNPKVFDLCRGIETFFKEADTGILQIPGEVETAIWNEGGKYYLYHPWPADKYGNRVSLQGGGKACVLCFNKMSRLCDHFLESNKDLKRKPFSISEVKVYPMQKLPQPVNSLKPVGPNRWVIRGSFHEGDERFPEEHRNKQATPAAITAIAYSRLVDPSEWTTEDMDETLMRGDILYENTIENLEKMGISFDSPPREEEEMEGEAEDYPSGPAGTLAAADILPRFKVTDMDFIETEVLDGAYSGVLPGDSESGMLSLKDSLKAMFKDNRAAVLTARGSSLGVWKHENHFYMYDPHPCNEEGFPGEADDPRSAAAMIRTKTVNELADAIMANLPTGPDDSFNLSPVDVYPSKLLPEIGAPEHKLDNKAFDWMKRGMAAILMGPRGENAAIGKICKKAGVPADDLAGRVIGLPAAAAFCAATDAVPPPFMHQDHMYNFLDAGAEYYRNHVKKTGRKDITVDDLKEKFEMGVNTFSIELDEPKRLPLRIPDKPEEGGEEEGGGNALMEGEEAPPPEPKEMKELLFKMWYDNTKPTSISLLVGDYHQLGVWMAAGGKVVVFDPAPTLTKGLLTPQRIAKGDELRLQRIKDETVTEGADEAEDEEVGGEGEEKPEPEPEFVPPESCPALMVFATPGEFIDRLVERGTLDPKQMIAPYWLYPVNVTNELTSVLKEKRPGAKGDGDEGVGEEEEDVLVEPLNEEAIGKYFDRCTRSIASIRGRIAQNEKFFMDIPNRDNQDAANAVMGIVVESIEPYMFWKSKLIDSILKYGDRLYTLSLPKAANPPKLRPDECTPEFHVTAFNIRLEVEPDVVAGDYKAPQTGGVLNLKKAIMKFFESGHSSGVLCCKGYCVGLWRGTDGKAYCYWDPHPTGPQGRTSPGGSAALVLFSDLDELSDTFKHNIEALSKPGTNKFTISAVKVFWDVSRTPATVTPQGAVPDEGYEWKVLTAFVEVARGRTLLRGSLPPDLYKFARDALIQSACSAIVGTCMSHVRRPHLWTRKTVDEILSIGCQLFTSSIQQLGYEFRPGDDVLLPLQVVKRYRIGSNYVRFDLQQVFTGRLEQREPTAMNARAALEHFFDTHTHGVMWSTPYAVSVFKVKGAPAFYMVDPHACGASGLRIDAKDEGAPCVLTFTSPKLMAFSYLQNFPVQERTRHEFILYSLTMNVKPIKNLVVEPPLIKDPNPYLVPATSKVDFAGRKRRADERDRRHPPGSVTCLDAQRAADQKDKQDRKYRGIRNSSGWLVLVDGSAFLSAAHSMACKKFPYASRNNQALACCVMAVAMSRVEDVCRWCNITLDQILDSGSQLYQDSYLHYRPQGTKLLQINQVLRKFYTPGNCVCRVTVYKPRQEGKVGSDLFDKVMQFFKEERSGVFVAGDGQFAVTLFRTQRGYYMFDPADRDRYGRAVAPPCIGKARACFSSYPTIKALCEKLAANIPPEQIKAEKKAEVTASKDTEGKESAATVRFEEPPGFSIYGMEVTNLRRPNQHEK